MENAMQTSADTCSPDGFRIKRRRVADAASSTTSCAVVVFASALQPAAPLRLQSSPSDRVVLGNLTTTMLNTHTSRSSVASDEASVDGTRELNACDSGFVDNSIKQHQQSTIGHHNDKRPHADSQETANQDISEIALQEIEASFDILDTHFNTNLSFESPVFNSSVAKSSTVQTVRTLKTKSISCGYHSTRQPDQPEQSEQQQQEQAPHTVRFQQSESHLQHALQLDETREQRINRAMEASTQHLKCASVPSHLERFIGDMTRKHTLPILTSSKHRDLASITPNTLADLICGKYKDEIDEYFIFDARYPYEYRGGHIRNSVNVYDKESLFRELFDEQSTAKHTKPVVLIFHCEFSSERGPRLMREIRERDRLLNQDKYPHLYYPEIYLLEGGYKEFFQNHDSLCDPRSYLPMLHDNHRDDLKFFRKKSKTWEGLARREKQTLNKATKLTF